LETLRFTGFFKLFKRKTVYVLLTLFFLYHSLFNVYVAQKVSSWLVPKFLQGEYHFQWEKFSLFYGVELNDIQLKGTKEFSNDVVFQADSFHFRYNLPLLLLGRLKLSEVSLTKPKLFLRESRGIWNISTCLVEGEKKEKVEDESTKIDEIATYVPVSAFLQLQLIEPEIRVVQESQSSQLKLLGPSLYLTLDTYRFRKIPLNFKILELPEVLMLSVNPQKDLLFEYEDPKLKVTAPLTFSLNLQNNPKILGIYTSSFVFSGKDILLQIKPNQSTHVDFHIGYDLGFKEPEDILELNEFVVQFGKQKWLSFKGKMGKVSTNNPNFELSAEPSIINLNAFNELYSKLPGLPFHRFAGIINFDELKVDGDLKNILTNIKINAKDVSYKNSSQSYSIPKFLLDTEAKINLSQEESSSATIPFVSELKVRPLALSFNGANVFLESEIHSKKIFAALKIENFNLQEFVKSVGGRINGKLQVQGENLSLIQLGLDLNWVGFHLFTSSFKTNPGTLSGKVNGSLEVQKDFQIKNILVQMLSLRLFNPSGQEAISLNTAGSIPEFSPFSLGLRNFFLQLRLRKILPILPYSLLEKVSPLREVLGEDVSLKSDLNLNFQKGIEIQGNLSPIIPHLLIKDVNINLHTILNSDENGSIAIPRFQIQGFSKALNGTFSGNLKKNAQGDGPLGDFIQMLV
jgi:hypothetical protein